MQNKRTYASRFFELFTLPASLKLNTQRRSAPSTRAFKEEEERSVFISVTLMKGISGYKITVSIIGITFCMWRVQPCDSDLKEKFLSLIVCLFYPHFSFFFLLPTFFVIRIFFPSAFFYPHFPIRIRHPQVSGPRFTDTRTVRAIARALKWLFFSLLAKQNFEFLVFSFKK